MSFPSIILFGDSLTEQSFSPEKQGFGASLSNTYARRADVLNRGLSGYNSEWLLPWLQQILAAQVSEVLLWVIWVGANDACLPDFVYHVPIQKYKENIRKMIASIHKHEHSKNSRILIVTPPPIDREMLKVYHRRAGADRSFAVTAEYAAAAKAVGQEYNDGNDSRVSTLDYYGVLLESCSGEAGVNKDETPNLRGYFTDGLHLGPKGYKLLYKAFEAHLDKQWPDLKRENLPLMAPWVGDLKVVKDFESSTVKHDEI